MRIATPAFFCFPFAWNIFLHPLTFSQYMSLDLKWVSCKEHTYGSFPYNITYAYTTGSVLAELVDLRDTPSTSKTLRVVWTNYITGLLNSSGSLNTTYVQKSIEQAFSQSPYLKAGK